MFDQQNSIWRSKKNVIVDSDCGRDNAGHRYKPSIMTDLRFELEESLTTRPLTICFILDSTAACWQARLSSVVFLGGHSSDPCFVLLSWLESRPSPIGGRGVSNSERDIESPLSPSTGELTARSSACQLAAT